MTKYENTKVGSNSEWENTVKKFPNWAPDPIFFLAGDHALVERLCTYPEMKKVWEQLFKWCSNTMADRGFEDSSKALFEKSLLYNIGNIAQQCTAANLGIAILTPTKREKLTARISRQAKALRNSLDELNAPTYISDYISCKARLEDECLQQMEFLLHNYSGTKMFNEVLTMLDKAPPKDHVPSDDWDESQLDEFMEVNHALLFFDSTYHSNHHSNATIYDVLDGIVKINHSDFPEPVVKKAKKNNERRLFTIRLFAEFFQNALQRNPRTKPEREVIAILAQTVLDDDNVGEDTVKDALKNHEL